MTRRELAQHVFDTAPAGSPEHDLAKAMLQTGAGAPRKMRPADIAEARRRLAAGESKEAVAVAFKVSVRTLDRRVGGK